MITSFRIFKLHAHFPAESDTPCHIYHQPKTLTIPFTGRHTNYICTDSSHRDVARCEESGRAPNPGRSGEAGGKRACGAALSSGAAHGDDEPIYDRPPFLHLHYTNPPPPPSFPSLSRHDTQAIDGTRQTAHTIKDTTKKLSAVHTAGAVPQHQTVLAAAHAVALAHVSSKHARDAARLVAERKVSVSVHSVPSVCFLCLSSCTLSLNPETNKETEA